LTATKLLFFSIKLYLLAPDLVPEGWHPVLAQFHQHSETFSDNYNYSHAIFQIWYLILQQEAPAASAESQFVVFWFWVAMSFDRDGVLKDPQYLTGHVAAIIHLAKLIALVSAQEERYHSITDPR
jgi:hypothetical protein